MNDRQYAQFTKNLQFSHLSQVYRTFPYSKTATYQLQNIKMLSL